MYESKNAVSFRPVESATDDDILCVEVWDFDPAETVKEKVTKIGDIKGFKGMRRFIKEISVTATNGKHDNEIIGGTLIPLKVIKKKKTPFFFLNYTHTCDLVVLDDTFSRSNSLV